jgi:tRNA(His) guanylyltransferase
MFVVFLSLNSCRKLISTIASLFSSSFVFYWKTYFEDVELKYPPTFDARIICYPTKKSVKDYFCWRQVDCKVTWTFKDIFLDQLLYFSGHINNQYNYCFWSLVEKNGKSHTEAYNFLKVTIV